MDLPHVFQLSRVALACTLYLGSAPCLATEVYKWVDANGDVHFGDRPPGAGAVGPHLAEPRAEHQGVAHARGPALVDDLGARRRWRAAARIRRWPSAGA